MFNHQSVDVGSTAREQFIDNIADGYVALDTDDHIVDINATAYRLLAPLMRNVIGQPVNQALGRWSDVMNSQGALLGIPDPNAVMQQGAARRFMHIRIAPILGEGERQVGRLVMLHDVTELQEHLTEINTLQEKLRDEAILDELTGVYNRRYLNGLLTRVLAQARRESQPVSVVQVDIDHFKDVNEKFGQDGGDLVLRQTADFLRRNVRMSDAICRLGGDEFVTVLPNTPQDGALTLAERFRGGYSARAIDVGGVPLHLTLSLGIATFPKSASDADDMIAAADLAMAAAKRAGRDRTATALPINMR
ncbi:MAG TPA: sensor domain-containing diguanylate cyclase [Anaerolineae bacterium]